MGISLAFFVIIVCLLVLSLFLLYKLFPYKGRAERLKQELNNQDLDYYIRQIESLGYDVSIKVRKEKGKSSVKQSSPPVNKQSKKASTHTSSMDELLPKKDRKKK